MNQRHKYEHIASIYDIGLEMIGAFIKEKVKN